MKSTRLKFSLQLLFFLLLGLMDLRAFVFIIVIIIIMNILLSRSFKIVFVFEKIDLRIEQKHLSF